jgi:hypothetical protein
MKRRDIEQLPSVVGKRRRAIDWSRVVYITEHVDGTANLYFDHFILPGTRESFRDWLGTELPFDEAVRRWRVWKGEEDGGIIMAAMRKLRG